MVEDKGVRGESVCISFLFDCYDRDIEMVDVGDLMTFLYLLDRLAADPLLLPRRKSISPHSRTTPCGWLSAGN